MADPLDSMLDLMRRLPPTQIEENVSALVDMCPDYADDLLGSVDQPLKVKTDVATGKEYLTCDYNRDGDSYRYVWKNLPRESVLVAIDVHWGHLQIAVVQRIRSTFG
jgi:capping protein (actin filament) muscle Z-line, beta